VSVEHINQIAHFPKLAGQVSGHRGRNLQRLVDAAKVVVHGVQRHGIGVVGWHYPRINALADERWISDEGRELISKARALVPSLAEREQAALATREMPVETMEDYKRAGVLRVLQPKRFGGYQELSILLSRIVEELAHGCASSAWVYAVLAEHAWIIASFPEQAQIDVWGEDPLAVASSSLAPRATALRVTGGYRLSGLYPFSSGCGHAQWAIVGAFCEDASGRRHQRYMLVPMSEIDVIDDWHTLGLRGTGSRTLNLRDVFIPEHRSVRFSDLVEGTPPGLRMHPDYPMLRAPRPLLAIYSQPPVTVTLGRRALDLVASLLSGRVSRGLTKMAESEVVQMKIAESAAEIDMATLVLHTRRRRSMDVLMSGAPIPKEEFLETRRDLVFAQRNVRLAVERLCEISSTELVYDTSPL